MAYSKKLTDILEYYAPIFADEYIFSTKDKKQLLDAAKWVEDNNLFFDKKPFKFSDYAINIPIYGANHEPTGEYEVRLSPDLILEVIDSNMRDARIVLKVDSGLVSELSRAAGEEIHNNIIVLRKKDFDYNKKLDDFANDYSIRLFPELLAFRVTNDGIYSCIIKEPVDLASIIYGGDMEEELLPEEDILNYNLIGLLSVLDDKANGPLLPPSIIIGKGSKEKN